ncbi:DUF2059 domain-containing protein [Ottowia sp.]|uniref:DUF2059 domain-containing protein n=1 Tax=Ottowia sp. TaxID=1898956 RepID=UPI003A8A2610
MAQSDSKRALAVKLAQMQSKADGEVLSAQLTASAVQPLLAGWSQRLDESVPPAKQKDVRDKLDVELKKFTDSTQKAVDAQVGKAAEAALVPIFMEKLSEDELKTIITYLESPVSAKFQALGPDASNAWAKRVIDTTKPAVENGAKTFDAAATRIVNAASSAPSGSGAAPKK